uniref:TSA: Wollemia nobilis Ref_Wollemi_Transcript_18933_2194 transcribed RNA sequence n=1 Tax=Wollemia nobilis TaxID=56998 RepID=A0A0C9RI34_9CONI
MASNEKASVTKELNARHRKILEGLMKLPENRECADCKSRGPRWASVNLGIFVCIQCSGIHRSLGVHISKVRSATLDTWLPEQVAFIQSMGNAKANSYWEAELPPNYDRVGLENFIRAKYEEKRWIPRNSRSPPRLVDEKYLSVEKQQTVNGRHHHADDVGLSHSEKEVDNFDKSNGRDQGHKHESSPSQDSRKLHQDTLKATAIPAIAPPKRSPQPAQSVSVSSSQKVEAQTDLFNLLSIDEPAETVEELPSQIDDDNSWAAFQSAEQLTEKKETSSSAAKNDVMAGLEDLFKPSPPVIDSMPQPQPQPQPQASPESQSQPQSQHQLPKDAKNDIMSLFEKSTMSSPYMLQQQQMAAFLAQQQSMLMAATAPPGKQAFMFQSQQQLPNNMDTKPGNSLGVTPEQALKNVHFQFPGMTIPGLVNNLGTQNVLQPSTQAGGFVQPNLSFPQVVAGSSGMYNGGISSIAMSYNSSSLSGQANPRPAAAASSEASTSSSGASYDFSSLVSGVLSKE